MSKDPSGSAAINYTVETPKVHTFIFILFFDRIFFDQKFFDEKIFDHIFRSQIFSRFQKSHLENCAMRPGASKQSI